MKIEIEDDALSWAIACGTFTVLASGLTWAITIYQLAELFAGGM